MASFSYSYNDSLQTDITYISAITLPKELFDQYLPLKSIEASAEAWLSNFLLYNNVENNTIWFSKFPSRI